MISFSRLLGSQEISSSKMANKIVNCLIIDPVFGIFVVAKIINNI